VIEGMTLRDWFAGQAMAAQMAASVSVVTSDDPDNPTTGHWPHARLWEEPEQDEIAELAYKYADKMLAARGTANKSVTGAGGVP
jgi:hypothetical protein